MFKVCTLISLYIYFITCFANSYAKSAIEELGDFTQVIVPAYAFGMAMNEKNCGGTKQFIYSFGATELSFFGLRTIIDEERPNHSDKNSFPSGHTAAAFSGATFIHKRYGIEKAIVPYLLAGFTGYSRIAAGKHHFHDVVAGMAIGSLFTWIFVSKESNFYALINLESMELGFKIEF
jgi:membrane-associated phospholipid phosphatase